MRYYINLHTSRGCPMGTIYGNNKKELIEEAQEQMGWLKKTDIARYYLHLNK